MLHQSPKLSQNIGFTSLLLLMFLVPLAKAHQVNTPEEHIDQVMRGIGIQYLISEDRKLPKSNRQKWEADLADYIDFASLNQGMRNRVKAAVAASDSSAMDDETTELMAEKAVLFLVPRHLADYTRAYLKKKHELDELKSCDGSIMAPEGDYTLCIKAVSESEIHAVFVDDTGKEMISMVFEQHGKWQLVNIVSEINEKTLMTIAMWK